jgi:hypothetical protein
MTTDKKLWKPSHKIIIDWHDGIVAALVQFDSIQNWFVVSLRTWDISTGLRIYFMKKLNAEKAREIFSILPPEKKIPNWILRVNEIESEELRKHLEAALNNPMEDSYAFMTNDIDEGVYVSSLDPDLTQSIKLLDIDEVVNLDDDSKKQWADVIFSA